MSKLICIPTIEGNYFAWINEINDNLMILSLQILYNNNLYEGIIGIENKPHSRRQNTNREFYNIIKDTIENINEIKYNYTLQSSSNNISLIIKVQI